MDVTSHLVTQAIFRVSFAACLTVGIIPVALTPPGFYRGSMAGLCVLNALAATLIFLTGEPSGSDRLLLGFGAILATFSFLSAIAGTPPSSRWRPYAVFVIGLIAFLASLFSARWVPAATGLGMTLAVMDLASGGLLLATILSAILLAVWHLCTPRMSQAPLIWIVRLLALALAIRVLAAVIVLAAEALRGEATILATIFLAFRCILAALGLWMLILLKRDVEDEAGEPRSSGSLIVGLLLVMIGELVTHLVPLDGLYPV